MAPWHGSEAAGILPLLLHTSLTLLGGFALTALLAVALLETLALAAR